MPKYLARLNPGSDGTWVAVALAFPNCWSRGRTRDEALQRLRDEVRYRIEHCPCSGVADDFVEIEVAHETRASGSDAGGGARAASPRVAEAAPRPMPQRGAVTQRSGWKRWDD